MESENNINKKKYQRKRNIHLGINVTQEEKNMIEKRMSQSGIKSTRAYITKMAIDGRVIHVELESVKEMVRLLSNISNNVNQIARNTNETNNIYRNEVEALCVHVDNIWVQTKEIMQKLSKL